MRISDWSSDVCSSDLDRRLLRSRLPGLVAVFHRPRRRLLRAEADGRPDVLRTAGGAARRGPAPPGGRRRRRHRHRPRCPDEGRRPDLRLRRGVPAARLHTLDGALRVPAAARVPVRGPRHPEAPRLLDRRHRHVLRVVRRRLRHPAAGAGGSTLSQFTVEILNGFAALLDPTVMAYMVVGFLIGAFFGAMPGLTAVLAIALLLPLTYSLDVATALVMCASIFMAGMYAGSITATTINIPGAPSSTMTAIEGYPLMKQGHGANALGHAALGSLIGGVIGALLMILLTPLAARASLLIDRKSTRLNSSH